MNKMEFVKRTVNKLRENGSKKRVGIPKQVFHISDNNGNSRDFSVKSFDRNVIYTIDDVSAIVDACVETMMDAIKHGEEITVRGFGTLGLKLRASRVVRHVDTGELVEVPAHYVAKFDVGHDLRICAKLFDQALKDGTLTPLYSCEDVPEGDIEDNTEGDIEDGDDE